MQLAVLMLAIGLASGAPAAAIDPPDARDFFAIDLPPACALSTTTDGPDFMVFSVACNGVAGVGIYVGNSADAAVPRSRSIDTGLCRWPSTIQVFALDVPAQQERFDRIAASVRPTSANADQPPNCRN